MSSEFLTQQRNFKRSPSVEKFRDCVRKQYKEKLKQERNNELSRRRHLFNSTLSAIQESLTPDEQIIVESELLNPDEILDLFEEVEKDLKYKESLHEAQQYNLYVEQETNSILDNLIGNCNVCDKLITNHSSNNNNNIICLDCIKNYFNNETL